MTTGVVGAQLVLAIVFGVSAAGKLLDLPGAVLAAEAFGVPRSTARLVGTALPPVEAALAVLLMFRVTVPYGAIAAAGLLLAFIAVITRTLARGEHPDCHCFGEIHSAPVSWRSLAGDFVLLALAGLAAVGSLNGHGRNLIGWLAGLDAITAIVSVLGACVLVLAWFAFQLLRQQGRLLIRIERLEQAQSDTAPSPSPMDLGVGITAPTFDLARLDGERVSLAALLADGRDRVLVFSDPACGPCATLLPELGRRQRDGNARAGVTVISRGSVEDNRAKASEHGLTEVLVQADNEIAEAYRAQVTPAAVVVSRDGRVASAVARGTADVQALIVAASGRSDVDEVAEMIR